MAKPVLVGLILAGVSLSYGEKAYASQHVFMYQRIGQQTCLITTTVRSDGSVVYALLPGCGTLVMPSASTGRSIWEGRPRIANQQLTTTPSGIITRIFYGTGITYLETSPPKQPDGGYVVLARQGQRYGFRLTSESGMAWPRVIEVVAVNDTGISLLLWPGGKIVHVSQGKPVQLQLAFDGAADVTFNLVQINADGSALLRVRFPAQPNSDQLAAQRRNELLATAALGTAGCMGLYFYAQQWIAARKGRVPRKWWGEHMHDPIAGDYFFSYQWDQQVFTRRHSHNK